MPIKKKKKKVKNEKENLSSAMLLFSFYLSFLVFIYQARAVFNSDLEVSLNGKTQWLKMNFFLVEQTMVSLIFL